MVQLNIHSEDQTCFEIVTPLDNKVYQQHETGADFKGIVFFCIILYQVVQLEIMSSPRQRRSYTQY